MISILHPIRTISLVALLLIFSDNTKGQLQDDKSDKGGECYKVLKDLAYSSSDPWLKMDLFLPEESNTPFPCVIVIKGGGFKSQNKGGQRFITYAENLVEHGYAAALISYRGRPDYEYKLTIADTKAAVRYIREISGAYNIDTHRIGALGSSAGASLAALLAVTGDIQEFEGKGGNPRFPSQIQSAVAFAGVFDFVARFSDSKQKTLQAHLAEKLESNAEWIGAPLMQNNKEWRSASAINYVDRNDPPILFLHCEDDPIVPYLQSEDMHEKMTKAGIHSELKVFKSGGHGFKQESAKESMTEMIRFFKKTL